MTPQNTEMRVVKIAFPETAHCSDYTNAVLDEYDFRAIRTLGEFDLAVYFYGTAPYEGDGQIILRSRAGLWYLRSLGHCSCYGPCDWNELGTAYKTLAELEANTSQEYKTEIAPLLEAIKTKGL